MCLFAVVGVIPAFADATWNGSTSQDWNTGANWSVNPPTGNLTINMATGNYPILTSAPSWGPVDAFIGNGSGNSGRFDQTSGSLATANSGVNGNWFFVGLNTGTGTYNLTGNGNLTVGKLWVGGEVFGENGTGTVTINTTGSLTANSTDDFSGWGQYQTSISVGWGSWPSGTGNGTLNLLNGTINSSNRAIWVGAWGSTGALNQSGGTINANGLSLGRWFNQNATVTISNGTFNAGFVDIGRTGNNGDTSHGTLTVNSNGIVNCEGDFVVAVDGSASSTGVLNINTGGIVNVASTTERWFMVGQYNYNNATVNINGGTLNLNANTDLRFSPNGNTGAGIVNLNSGAITGGSGSVLAFNQGNAIVNNTFNLNGGTLTIGQIISGGSAGTRVFNFNGGTLKAAASSATFFATGVASAANVLTNGAMIDSAGYNITIGQNLADGGGGGGLTKTGNGMLTLSGGYGYTGPTVVAAGTLALDVAQGTGSGELRVTNAALSLTLSSGGTYGYVGLPAAGATLDGNSALNINYGTVFANPSIAALGITGSLTISGTNTINISATGLSASATPIPLITVTTGTLSTNNFNLGTLPPGIKAVLTNSTSTSLDLLVTGAGQLLTWYGADSSGTILSNHWDLGTSLNWNFGAAAYQQYSGNSYGDNVTFDNNCASFLDQSTNVVLNGRVVPATVTFATGLPYSLTGAGGIDGVTSLCVTNFSAVNGSVFLGTSNGYTGGTIIGASTLIITNDNALGASSGGVTLGGGTLQFDGNVVSSRSISVIANSTLAVASGATAQLNGAVSASAVVTKDGSGTLDVAGSIVAPGVLNFNNGTVAVTGVVTNGGTLFVGSGAGLQGTANVTGSAAVTVGQFLVVGGNGGNGAMNITNGTITAGYDAEIGGNSTSGSGTLTMSGGSLIANIVTVGRGNNNVSTVNGLLDLTGGTVTSRTWFTLGFAGSSSDFGTVTNTGGIINVNRSGGGNMEIGVFDASTCLFVQNSGAVNLLNNAYLTFGNGGNHSGVGTFDHNGGPVTFYSDGGTNSGGTGYLRLGTGGDTGAYLYNLNGGILTVPSIQRTASGGSGTFAFNGGTLKPTASTATFMQGLTAANVMANGAIIDTTNCNITIAQNLLDGGSGGGLIKAGSGALTLSGANTYTGTTVVTNGTLYLTPVQQTATPVVVADSATLGIATSTTNGAAVGNLTLGSTGAATLSVSYTAPGNPTNVALTAGTVTVNGGSSIKIGGLFSVGTFPLLKYGSLPALPALVAPRGTTAVLTNDTVNGILYVNVTATGGGIVWNGTTGLITNLWDIDITTNWVTGTTPTTYQEATPPGDVVTFNDAGSGTVLVSNTVSPANVTIHNSGVNYTFAGTGQISSTAGLTKAGAGTATLSLPGTYSASTVVSNGALNLGANQTFANLAGNGTIGTASGTPTLTVNSSTNTTFSGPIQGGLTLTKNGNGTLTLSSNYNAGQMRLNAGKILLAASNTVSGDMMIGEGATGSGTVDIVSGGSVRMPSSWLFVGHNGGTGQLDVSGNGSISTLRLWVAGAFYGDNGTGVANIDTTGTITGTDGITLGQAWNGGTANATLNLTNGTLVSNYEIYVGCDANGGSTANATFNQTGGSVSSAAWLVIGRGGSGGTTIGTYNLSGGSVTAATTTAGSFATLASFAGSQGTLNVSGGSFTVASSRRMYVGEGAAGILNVSGSGLVTCSNIPDGGIRLGVGSAATGTVNLNGGTIQAALISKGAGSGTWNFNGGLLRAVASNTTFMEGLTAANVLTNGAHIDTAGNDIAIAQPLLNNGLEQDGGLTKTGNGTLFLNGANTYTNVTTVNAGLLGGTGAIAGAVVVNSGAGLAPGNSIGTLTLSGDITLHNASTNVFEVDGSTPTNDLVVAGANVTYGGVLKVVPGGALTAGQEFQLFSGAGTTNTSSFASIQSVGSPATFSFTNGWLKVLSVMAVNPTNLTYSVSGSTVTLSWPADHLGWALETNAVSVDVTNQWHVWPGSTAVTSQAFALDPSKTNVFFRMIKP